ncbi:MAG TPA: HEPN domain-containing protein [Rudaea sp.]|jgi:hypothetical protein|uniref:HEPN domain-containing protein n=1 Tax=Rudaea sp. TaxID=2136325 RepID=UPI002F91E1FB
MANDLPKLGADFELWGHWWLPEHESNQVTGCLSSRGGNLELKLLGKFDAIDINRRHLSVPIIHGVGDTKTFTLWNAIQGQFGFRAPGTVEQRFEGMRVLTGRFLPERSSVQFTGLSLHAANLGPWSNLQPVDSSFSAENPLDLSYRLVANRSREMALPDCGLVLTIGASFSSRNEEFSSYGFNVFPSLHVGFLAPQLFEGVMKWAGSLQRIFSLLIGTELIAEKASVEIDGGKKLDNVLGLLFEHAPPENQKTLSVYEVLAPFSTLQDKAPNVFARWFSEEPRIKDAVDLFLGTTRQRSLSTHMELTTLAQALETFHRNVHGGGYMTRKEYRPIEKMIIDSIPQNMDAGISDSIKERLRHAYEFTFRARLEMLLTKFSDELLKSLDVDRGTFPSEVSKARNEFTHWDAETNAPRLSGADLSNLVSKLKAFTRLVLLSHLGVPLGSVVQRMIENKYLYLPEWKKIEHT